VNLLCFIALLPFLYYTLIINGAVFGVRSNYCSGKTDDEYVFTLDGKPINYSKSRRGWERVRKAAGLKETHMHDARHTFATVCHDHELDDMTIKNLLGQKTIQVTRQYVHPSLETIGKRLKKIEEEKVLGTLLAPLAENEIPV